MNLRNRIASWPHPYSASNYLPSPLKNAWRLSHFTTLATILPHLVDNRKVSRSHHYNDPQKEDRSKPVRNMQSRPSTGPSNTSPHQRISIVTYTYYSIQRKFLIATYTYFCRPKKAPWSIPKQQGECPCLKEFIPGSDYIFTQACWKPAAWKLFHTETYCWVLWS